MIGNLTSTQIATILEALPVDISFVDENDTIRFWNRHESRVFKRHPAVLGKTVQKCHPPASVDKVNRLISDLKSGRKDVEEFWIDLKGRKIYIRYFAVRDKEGRYLGTLEASQDITDIKKIEGEKRLLK